MTNDSFQGLLDFQKKSLVLFILSTVSRLCPSLVTRRSLHSLSYSTCTLKLMRLTCGESKGLLIGWLVLLVFLLMQKVY